MTGNPTFNLENSPPPVKRPVPYIPPPTCHLNHQNKPIISESSQPLPLIFSTPLQAHPQTPLHNTPILSFKSALSLNTHTYGPILNNLYIHVPAVILLLNTSTLSSIPAPSPSTCPASAPYSAIPVPSPSTHPPSAPYQPRPRPHQHIQPHLHTSPVPLYLSTLSSRAALPPQHIHSQLHSSPVPINTSTLSSIPAPSLSTHSLHSSIPAPSLLNTSTLSSIPAPSLSTHPASPPYQPCPPLFIHPQLQTSPSPSTYPLSATFQPVPLNTSTLSSHTSPVPSQNIHPQLNTRSRIIAKINIKLGFDLTMEVCRKNLD
ncbi:uncharacterized protein LOC144625009 [Crassostrea virginica]